jgi:hypothetical protein
LAERCFRRGLSERHFSISEDIFGEPMGSTPDGDAGPPLAGTALPKNIKVDRAGAARVRVNGRV